MTTEEIMTAFDGDEFSPYTVGKTLNRLIGNLPPQMVYNYISTEKLPTRRGNTGKLYLTRDDVEQFVTKVTDSRAKKAAKEAEQADAE